MTLIPLTLAWMAGITIGMGLQPPWPAAALLVAGLTALLWLWYGQPAPAGSDRLPWSLSILLGKLGPPRRLIGLALVAALGMLRWSLAQPAFGPGEVAYYVDEAVEVRGTVVGEGEARAQGILFPLRVEALRLPGEVWRRVRGKVQVQGDRFLTVGYGDRLVLAGELRRPRRGGRFSYRDHLARQGIHALVGKVTILEQLEEPGGPWLTGRLYRLRGWARRRIERLLPEPQASLLVGILLGSRTTMPAEVQEAFSRSGTTHILAISGWNITIVAGFLAAAGRRLPGRFPLLLIVAGVILYTLFVGAGAAVLRSALMGLLYVLAQSVGRPGDGITALAASAWLMTLGNPGILGDIGFQLSLTATLGMLLFVPIWMEALDRWPGFLAESLAATLASQLLTWPLIAFYFRQFSLVVPLSNLLACPSLAPVMLLGMLALLLGGIPGLGAVLGGATWLVSTYMLAVVDWTGRLSWAAVALPVLGPSFTVLYYGGVGWWWWRYRAAGEGGA